MRHATLNYRNIFLTQFYSRFHDKVVIEEELNELRNQNAVSWETTKYHLKLAKTNTSLRNIEQLTLVSSEEECEADLQAVFDNRWELFLTQYLSKMSPPENKMLVSKYLHWQAVMDLCWPTACPWRFCGQVFQVKTTCLNARLPGVLKRAEWGRSL